MKMAALITTVLVLSANAALAHDIYGHSSGNLQRYGGHWRYMHRDWSPPGGHRHSACWEWNYLEGEWEWTC